MLRLILGRRQSGKTTYCINKARSAVEAGKKVIFLVPEQYSFECQRMLLKQQGPQISNKIAIHSFSSLCTEIGNALGGNAGKTVDDGIRFILIKRSLAAVKDGLTHYARYVGSDEFARKLLLIFSEFKQAGVCPEQLKTMAKAAETPLLSEKLSDMATVMGAYDSLIGKQFIEPFDQIEKTADRMQDNSFFKNTVIFADGFKGFTDSQYKLISRMTAGCDDFYAALCCDSDDPVPETDIFKNVTDAAIRLKRTAESCGVGVADTVILDRRPDNPDIAAFESFAAGRGTGEGLKNNGSVKLSVCRSVYDEADTVIRDIRRKVREYGRRYRDFVIITRTDGAYRSAFSLLAQKYGVPLFCDRRTPASELPISVFVVSALKAADKFDTEDLLAYLKTGLAGVSAEETAELENYAFVWGIDGKKWLDEKILDPSGYKDPGRKTDEKTVERISNIRRRALCPLLKLRENDRTSAESIGLAVMKLIDGCGTVNALKTLADGLDKDGNSAEADKQRKGYDVFTETLNKVVTASENDRFGLSEFADVLWAALSFESVGEIPQKKDEVLYGTADRIRTADRKVVYVVGVNEGVFPPPVGDGGLLSESERRAVIENGVSISDCGISDCIDEQFMYYHSLISASDEINISCSEIFADGSAAEPSEMFRAAMKVIGEPIRPNDNAFGIDDIETKEPAFKKYALNFRSGGKPMAALSEIFKNDPEYRDRCSLLETYKNGEKFALSADAAHALYGDAHQLSSSEITDFSDCRFKHFCSYGIHVNKIEKADFDPRIRGKMIHFVLENFVRSHMNDIGTLSAETVENEAEKLCDEYVSLVMTVENEADADKKFLYMTGIIKRICTVLLTALNNEFGQSCFSPAACEYRIESKNGISVSVGGNCGTVLFKGTVDRIDTTDDGMIRVVDYKTGGKDFSLDKLLYGLDSQMLLYLYFCVNECADTFGADHPAGVLYFPAQMPDSPTDGFVKMKGIIDPDSLALMEKDGAGKIIPLKLNKDGILSQRSEDSAITADEFSLVFRYLEKMLRRIGADIFGGIIDPMPLYDDNAAACKFCDFASACRVASTVSPVVAEKHSKAETIEIMKKETEEI